MWRGGARAEGVSPSGARSKTGTSASRAPGRRGLHWLLLGLLVALAACLGPSSTGGANGNLLLGKSPKAAPGVLSATLLTDGVAAPPGDDWETDVSVQLADVDSSVTYDLGAVVAVHALWFQGDHNDEYRFMGSEDGSVFEQLWDAPRVRAAGMQERSIDGLDARARYLRVQPLRGDGRYALSELAVFEQVPAVFPPEMSRQRGAPLEVVVRTKLLMFAAAAIACVFLAYQGAPWWWLLMCAALPIAALADGVHMLARAWPVEQRQVSMVRAVVAAIAAAAVLREVFGPPRWRPQRAVIAASLGFSAVVAVLAFYNLGRPQFWNNRERAVTAVHLLDLRQYYGTVKYFDELGYRDMFAADVAAFVEDHPGVTLDSLSDTPMRDLTTHRMSTVGAQRDRIASVKQHFSPERWEAYKRDARYFREVMGDQDYLRYMIDHGGNATPVWITVAHFLFSVLPTSMAAFELTALLDPLLFAITFAAIWRCFGYRSMAVVMVVFGANDFIMYGTNWGGATLRHDWLMLIGLGACTLKRQRWALGGFLLALSTMIRAFPAVTLVGAALPSLWWVVDRRRATRRWPRLRELHDAQRPIVTVLGVALLTAVALVALTSLRWSLAAWADWLVKVAQLNADSHANSIALRGLVAGWQVGHQQLVIARWPLLATLIVLFVAGVVLTCRRKPLEQAAIAALMLVPVVFYAANYYIHIVCFLPLLAVEQRPQPGGAPLSGSGAAVWLTLLGLCVAQYWTVLVTDVPLHFHLATVLLFAALATILIILLRADVREGRLNFLARFFAASPAREEPLGGSSSG
jgi:hypothetical protein